jgi:putative transcriptional regulator
MHTGMFLNSTSLLDGSFFEKSVILLTEYNEKGAMGFVINKLFPRQFNELEEFSNSIPFPLYDGGPVDREHLFFVHRRPDLIKGGVPLSGNSFTCLGGDFREAVKLINNNTLTGKDIRLFIGYCGWDSGELEAEIAEGSWQVTEKAAGFW